MLGVELRGATHHVPGPEDVVRDRIGDVLFHQRHVLVGRRVEHGVGAETPEHATNARQVSHVRDHRAELQRRMRRAQLVQDIEDLVLPVPQEHQVRRAEPSQLAR